jgi:hypothetical protein
MARAERRRWHPLDIAVLVLLGLALVDMFVSILIYLDGAS